MANTFVPEVTVDKVKKKKKPSMGKPKRVPQRRNGLAGKRKNKASKAKKEYDRKYHATKKRKKYRAELNRANAKNPNKKGEDKSHTKDGRLVNEKQSKNRARNQPRKSKK